MGIVNPPEVHPAIMRALYRLCLALGPGFTASRDDYVGLLAPNPPIDEGDDPDAAARQTVREAEEIGLLEASPDAKAGALRLALPTPPADSGPQDADAFLARELRRLILSPSNNAPLFADAAGPEEGAERASNETLSTERAREFSRIQAWILQQGPIGVALGYEHKQPQCNVTRLQERYSGRDLVQNATRWNSFRRWSLYLGFSRQVQGSVVADPTRAVVEETRQP